MFFPPDIEEFEKMDDREDRQLKKSEVEFLQKLEPLE